MCSARSWAAARSAPCRTTVPPSARTARTFSAAAAAGMTTVQGVSNNAQAYAIDWAWLPVE
jgi:uncharacterized protein YaiE (UPF0345 family)